jgi:hypothetical protein
MPVVPMMSLHFKRAKSFTATVDGGTRKFLAQPGFVAQQVPFWVADTPTFQQGIKDGSIVNLTPPALMPGYEAPKKSKKAEPETEVTAEEVPEPEPEPKPEQVAPKVPFGGQPLTPAQPPATARIGQVRATSARKG